MTSQDHSPAVLAPESGLYGNILVALDSSDHANRGMSEAAELAALCKGSITGTHVYAAKLHDTRFRQMEGGLPEQFHKEPELERQREVHDDLISRGLSIITDSYMDQAEKSSFARGVELARCSLEGKNYRALASEVNSGRHDLLVMGALGLGAIAGSRLGTVCTRVARRSN
ncbi:MAG: universal stress protein, partial [Woeseia sp.]